MEMKILILVSLFSSVFAIIGYDCGGPTVNVSTFSILDIPECHLNESTEPETKEEVIQLLQLSDYNKVQAIQCKVEVDRTIYYCGMHSHVSIVENGRQQYLFMTPHDVCQGLVTTGTVAINSQTHITGISINSTSTRSVTLAGRTFFDGTCRGTNYNDPYGNWENVVVQAIVKVTVRQFSLPVKLATNEVLLPSGQRCPLQQEGCLDFEDGFTYWSSTPTDSCQFEKYNVLYDGKATKVNHKEDTGTTVYTVTTDNTAFALTITKQSNICGYTIFHTEHPKLFIYPVEKGRFKTKGPIQTENLDIFTYVNAKFAYVEKHLRSQIISMYRDIVKQRCQLEKQVLRNALTLINIAPEEVATTIAKEPGHLAIQAGEAIHLIKCIPITCTFRETKDCYNELPVSYKNQSRFLTPRNHILTKVGTKRECNDILPPIFKMQGAWYRLTPRPMENPSPAILQPLTKLSWKYIEPRGLSTNGIYSGDELNKLKDHILFPVEKTAIINSMAQGISGRNYDKENVKFYNIMDEQSLKEIAESTGQRLWGGFLTFGTISAGFLGIYLVIHLIKAGINVILNGITLHSIYGWNIRLLAALWSSMTHFCVFLETKKSVSDKNAAADEKSETKRTSELPKVNFEEIELRSRDLQTIRTDHPLSRDSL